VVGYGTNRAGQPPPGPLLIKEGNYPEHFHLSRRAEGTWNLRSEFVTFLICGHFRVLKSFVFNPDLCANLRKSQTLRMTGRVRAGALRVKNPCGSFAALSRKSSPDSARSSCPWVGRRPTTTQNDREGLSA